MSTASKKKLAYINKIAKERGYVLDYHKVLVENDFEAMQRINELLETLYVKKRSLEARTKELLTIFGLILRRASRGQIQSHINAAVELGVSRQEILEAIELTLPMAGFAIFQLGFDAWRDFFKAKGIEPTVKVFQGGTGAP